MSSVTTYIYS